MAPASGEAVIAIYNHDLLLNADEPQRARSQYPHVGQFLDWPALRQAFGPIDRRANDRRARARKSGYAAVALGTTALCLAALEPRIHEFHLGRGLDLLLAAGILLMGVLAFALGSGVLRGEGKREWLHYRASTERLRQLHFQWLTRRAFQIAAAASPAQVKALSDERDQLLSRLEDKLPYKKTALAASIVEDRGASRTWLVDEEPPPKIHDPKVLEELFTAYRQLRLDHQSDYAAKKLEFGTGLWPDEPRGRARRITAIALFLTVGIIGVHVVATLSLLPAEERSPTLGAWLQTIAILVALLALGLRALEGGLRTGIDVVRYTRYTGDVEEIARRFEDGSPFQRVEQMARMEELSYRELRDFLADSEEAEFLI